MNENMAHDLEIEEEAVEEQFDNYRFMSIDCHHWYYDNLLIKKVLLEKGIFGDRLAELLPDFYDRL